MKKWIKRTVWSVVISILSIIVLVLGAIAVVVNIVFTPEKLTPIVERAADEFLTANLRFGSVELTFFSTFPNFGLRLTDGSLTSAPTGDSLVSESRLSDTIVSFRAVDVVVNPVALVKDKRIVIKRVALLRPNIYAFVDSTGVANWDIMKTPSAEVDTTAAASDSSAFQSEIAISGVRIADGSITLDDRQSGIFTRADSINLKLSGNLMAKASEVDMQMSLRRGLLWQNNELMVSNINLGIETAAAIDSSQLIVRRAVVDLNGMRMGFGGRIVRDSVDLTFGLEVPSLATLLDLIPTTIIDAKSAGKLSTTGSVNVNGTLKGCYTNGEIPVLRSTVDISEATAHYRTMPVGIDRLSMQAILLLDLNRRESSYISIQKFHFSGAETKLDLTALAGDLLGNQSLALEASGKVDFGSLSKIFPLAPGVSLDGVLTTNIKGSTNRRQIERGDYARIQANGEVKLQGVALRAKARGFDFTTDMARVSLSNMPDNGALSVKSEMSNLKLRAADRLAVELGRADADLLGVASNDSTSSLGGRVSYASLHANAAGDTLELYSAATVATVGLSKALSLRLETDSMALRAVNSVALLGRAGFDLTVTRQSIDGKLGFGGLKIRTPQFPLPISMPATDIRLNNQKLTLNGAHLLVGRSDVTLSGTVSGLMEASRGEGPLVVRATVKSSRVDITQIIHALSRASETTKADTTLLSTTAIMNTTDQIAAADNATEGTLETFVVPPLIDFDLQTSIAHVEFGTLSVDELRGRVAINKGEVHLDGLALSTLGARLRTSAKYSARSDSSATATLDVKAADIHVENIIALIPAIDSLVPMLRSFEGVVDFSIAARTAIGPQMSMKLDDIQAAVSIRGENLTLLEGETFAEISKMLMFKNKKRNEVDSISVQMAVHDGAVEIYPFLLQIDRYRVAVGGEHHLDNKFDYHVSVLKSPIPFKMGINISGSLDKMKVGIGKTQYKFLSDPTRSTELNPAFLKLQDNILRQAGI